MMLQRAESLTWHMDRDAVEAVAQELQRSDQDPDLEGGHDSGSINPRDADVAQTSRCQGDPNLQAGGGDEEVVVLDFGDEECDAELDDGSSIFCLKGDLEQGAAEKVHILQWVAANITPPHVIRALC